jgi:archaellum component FlaC
MEKENINNNIEDDLNRRNRNWQEIEDFIEDTNAKILALEQRIEELETE